VTENFVTGMLRRWCFVGILPCRRL